MKFPVLSGLILGAVSHAAVIEVSDDASLRKALEGAAAGDEIVVAAGKYRGGYHVKGRSGTADRPIVLRGADAADAPVFKGGGSTGFQFSDGSHWRIEDLVVEGYPGNGVNIDDGGSYATPAIGMVLRGVTVRRIGPRGNHDGIKLSGLVDFRVIDCRIEGWGGSAIDLVGCRDGVIEGCELVGLAGFGQDSGIQLKGGTARVRVKRCDFKNAGTRAVNLGGSTGLEFFRPEVGKFEAEEIEVSDCVFEGGGAAVAFVTSRGGKVHHNRIVRPEKWVLRILQEQPVPEFGKTRDGEFFRNVIELAADHRSVVNVGPDTAPETFEFRENAWFHEGGRHLVELPTEETGGVYGKRPEALTSYGPRDQVSSEASQR